MKAFNDYCEVTIRCASEENAKTVGTALHNLFRGNQDYIDSNLILNMDNRQITITYDEECGKMAELPFLHKLLMSGDVDRFRE